MSALLQTRSANDTRALLIELLCEELPPKSLPALGRAFAHNLHEGLARQGLLADGCTARDFATPRRLAVHLSAVLAQAPQRRFTEKLMPLAIGLDANGDCTPALVKKLAAKGLSHLKPADLQHVSDGKHTVLVAQGSVAGATLQGSLQSVLDQAVAQLPIAKVMRYQLADGSNVKFVRPVHALTVLWGGEVLPVTVLGLAAGCTTQGHRFMGAQHIALHDAGSYEAQLHDEGKVVAAFAQRRALIMQQLQHQAQVLNASLGAAQDVDTLLDEVTALVEWPAVYVGQFDPGFLDVPPECLILTMRLNQKYFPLFDPNNGKLTHRFLIVSNMQLDDPVNIVRGNERVVRPRLADAQFFYQTDRKVTLESRVDSLKTRLYHHKLGSQYERVARVRAIACDIVRCIAQVRPGADVQTWGNQVDRAALLAKADLDTLMVGEFPELQGVIGAYYAQADGEAAAVVTALRDQYRLRLDMPVDEHSLVSAILFMADRIETLVGMWGIGLAPTGERDPYGLRRAALGLISVYEQLQVGGWLPLGSNLLDSDALLQRSAALFTQADFTKETPAQVRVFINERYRHLLSARHERHIVDAVLAVNPPLHQVPQRVQACTAFVQLPQAASLVAANKRIGNLLKKAGDAARAAVDAQRLVEPAEKALAHTIERLSPAVQQQFDAGDFAASLATLAQAGQAVDQFFVDVMVMADDPAVRTNRLALLAALHHLMNQVADIARLAQ